MRPAGIRGAAWGAACALLTTLGCGQKAPGDDAMGAGGMGPGPSNGGSGGEGGEFTDYFPLVDGATYVYTHSSGWSETITVTKTTYEGAEAFQFSESVDPDGERTDSIFVQLGSKVVRVYKEVFDAAANDMLLSQVEYRPGFVRADNAWGEAAAGTEFTETYERTETEAAEAAKPTEERSHVFVLEGFEEVVTNAGRFTDCMRVRRQRTWETDLPSDEGQEKRFWFAPGIGKVQEETPENSSTERLESYDLP